MTECDIEDPTDYGSTVRNNLMKRPGYSPYCGSFHCTYHMPRMSWNGEQFVCTCGYETEFPVEFITTYKARWHQPTA